MQQKHQFQCKNNYKENTWSLGIKYYRNVINVYSCNMFSRLAEKYALKDKKIQEKKRVWINETDKNNNDEGGKKG